MNVVKMLTEKYNLNKDAFWQLRDNHIIKHDAVMAIAHQEGVKFGEPTVQILDNNNVAIYGIAKLGKDSVWTTGEANLGLNCKAPYPFAMAEKRWKDRATLMLIGVYHMGVYSDTEADSFAKETPMTANQYFRIEELLSIHDYDDEVLIKTNEIINDEKTTASMAQKVMERLKELKGLAE